MYAVWFNMMAKDSRARWPSDLITDSRVVHLWDEQKTIGTWYAQRVEAMKPRMASGSAGIDGAVLWDSYLIYGPQARWADPPDGLIRWGRTIVGTHDTLVGEFATLFGSASQQVRQREPDLGYEHHAVHVRP